MAKNFIYDDNLVISLQGLRSIEKAEFGSFETKKKNYVLEWRHKRTSGRINYEEKEKRDAMFEKICKAIDKNQFGKDNG